MTSEVVETRVARLWVDDDEIIHVVVQPGAEITAADLNEWFQARMLLMVSYRAAVIIDVREVESVADDVHLRGISEAESLSMKALAVVIDSGASVELGHLLMHFTTPASLFHDYEEGLDWLMQLSD